MSKQLFLRLVYCDAATNRTTKESMFEKTEKDVQDALEDYNKAILAEDKAGEQLAKRELLEGQDQSGITESEKKMIKKSVAKFEKNLRKARSKRQKLRKEFDERCKIRDAEVLATNNEVVEKKEEN